MEIWAKAGYFFQESKSPATIRSYPLSFKLHGSFPSGTSRFDFVDAAFYACGPKSEVKSDIVN
jgi:hypothetical protein